MILLRGDRIELPLFSPHFTHECYGPPDAEFDRCRECVHCHTRMDAYGLPEVKIVRWPGSTLIDTLSQVYEREGELKH